MLRDVTLAFVLLGLLSIIAMPGLAGAGVEVLVAKEVGAYQVKVIRGDAKDVVNWLQKNQYRFAPEDTAVFQKYAEKSWCFAVAKVKAGIPEKEFHTSDMLVAPLIFRFRSQGTYILWR